MHRRLLDLARSGRPFSVVVAAADIADALALVGPLGFRLVGRQAHARGVLLRFTP